MAKLPDMALLRGEPVGRGVRRIAVGLIDHALSAMDSDLAPGEQVHELRRMLKRHRSLARLIRTGLGETVYRRENRWARDLARAVSPVRDADACAEILAGLRPHLRGRAAAVADALARRLGSPMPEAQISDLDALLARIRRRLVYARQRISGWKLSGNDCLMPGGQRGYRRARRWWRRLMRAGDEADSEAFHEWRKEVKHHALHAAVLSGSWGRKRERLLADLGRLLGREHDLGVLAATAQNLLGRTAAPFIRAIVHRQALLRRQVLDAGRVLFRARTRDFAETTRKAWDRWR